MKNNRIKIVVLVTIGLLLVITLIPINAAAASPPTATFTANPSTIPKGYAGQYMITLSWSITGANSYSIKPNIASTYYKDVRQYTGTKTFSLTSTTTYVLTATGPGGSVTKKITVTVTAPKPTITFKVSPTSIEYGSSSILIWSSNDADKVSIKQPIEWLGLFIAGYSTIASGTYGSIIVRPTKTTTYTATATGTGGTTETSVTITVLRPPAPTVTMYVSGNSVNMKPGDKCLLYWGTGGQVTSLSISRPYDWWDATQWISGGTIYSSTSVHGPLAIYPQKTTTYTITVVGPGGTAKATATVKVK